MTKIYLSPAAHKNDHECSAVKGCTENTHCNEYLDYLEKYLVASGFEIKRNERGNVGDKGVKKAIDESNEWGADLHYVVHTNACTNHNAVGSRPMYYPKGLGKEWCDVIKMYRDIIYPFPVTPKANSNLAEIVRTNATCIYEELVFHDNYKDAKWLHDNMKLMAQYTAYALCYIFGMGFVDPYRIKGDVDGDGEVTSTDARIVLQASVGKVELDETQKLAGDMDGDGEITSTDARLILQKSINK